MTNLIKLILVFVMVVMMSDETLKAQVLETGIVFTGDSEDDEYWFYVGDIHGVMHRDDRPINDYFSIGEGDTATLKKRLREMTVFVKKQSAVKDRKAHLVIPVGFGRYLILRRDRSLKNRQFFAMEWSDKLPYENANPYQYFFDRDSAAHKFPVPLVSIQVNPGFEASTLKAIKFSPNDFMTFSTSLVRPPSLEKMTIEYEALEIEFLHHNTSLFRRLRTRGHLTTLLFWPTGFKMEEGSLIVVNMAYSYKQNGKVVESGLVSRSVKF